MKQSRVRAAHRRAGQPRDHRRRHRGTLVARRAHHARRRPLRARPVTAWRSQLGGALAAHRLDDLHVELRYSSWALLGSAIIECGKTTPGWSRYADDVAHQLRNQGLLGYDGGPVFDDLDGLTVPNAVEVFNRAVKTAIRASLSCRSRSTAIFDESTRPLPFGENKITPFMTNVSFHVAAIC